MSSQSNEIPTILDIIDQFGFHINALRGAQRGIASGLGINEPMSQDEAHSLFEAIIQNIERTVADLGHHRRND